MEVYTFATGTFAANCYVVTDGKKAAVIDPGDCSPALLSFIRDNDLHVMQILLTHGHADHITGAPQLRECTGAPISIHALDAPCTDGPLSLAEECGYPPVHFQADRLLQEGDTISVGKETLTVLHTPGHTPGGVCFLHENDRLLFSGDTLFCLTAGRTDLPGGDSAALMQSLDRLRKLEGDYKVYPGHERTTSLDAERKRNFYMRRLGK